MSDVSSISTLSTTHVEDREESSLAVGTVPDKDVPTIVATTPRANTTTTTTTDAPTNRDMPPPGSDAAESAAAASPSPDQVRLRLVNYDEWRGRNGVVSRSLTVGQIRSQPYFKNREVRFWVGEWQPSLQSTIGDLYDTCSKNGELVLGYSSHMPNLEITWTNCWHLNKQMVISSVLAEHCGVGEPESKR